MTLADLLRETLETDSQDVWKNERRESANETVQINFKCWIVLCLYAVAVPLRNQVMPLDMHPYVTTILLNFSSNKMPE